MKTWEKARKQIGHRSSEKQEEKGKKKRKKKRIRITGNYNSLNLILIHCKIMKWSLKPRIYLGDNRIMSSKRRRHCGARVVCVTNPPEAENGLGTQNTGWTHSNNTTWKADFFSSMGESIPETSKAAIWFCYRFSGVKHRTEFEGLKAVRLCKQKYLNAGVMDMEKNTSRL